MTSPWSRRSILALAPALAGCTLATFNTFVPTDGSARLVAKDLAFGPDPRQRLDIYAPDAPGERRPILFFVYGGSWNSGSKDDYAFVGKAFSAKGYVTGIADYRLVPQVRFPTFLDDGAAAAHLFRERAATYGGDPDRLFLAGHSAGAYNAVMLALDPHFLERAGVPRRSVRAVAGLSGPYDFYPYDDPVTVAAFATWPKPRETQPVDLVRPGAPPAFLCTGTADTLVFPRNTRALAAKLRAAGDVVEVRDYAGVDHPGTLLALAEPFRDKTPVLADVTAFFARHGGAPTS